MSEELWSAELFPQHRDERLHFRVYDDVFTVRIIEHLCIDSAVIHERAGHIPIRDNHSIKTTLLASQHIHKVLGACRIPGNKPVTSVAHCCFAAQIVEFENQISFFLFTHFKSPMTWCFAV